MHLGICFPTPLQYLPVQILQIFKLSSGQKVILHIPDKTFDFSFGLGTPDLAYLWHKSHLDGKVGKLGIPDDALTFPVVYDSLHVVGQNDLRNTSKVFKCVGHTPLEAAQITAGGEFYILGSGVSQDHDESWCVVQDTTRVSIWTLLRFW